MKNFTLPFLALVISGCSNLVPERLELEPKHSVLLIQDSDQDGISDYWDRCAHTPADSSVTSNGCPGDQDGDGVADYKDQCRDSNPAIHVCEHGCETHVASKVLSGIDRFATDSSTMGQAAKKDLAEFVRQLGDSKHVELEIVGHTDSVGATEYNQRLSELRAKIVAKQLAQLLPHDAVIRWSGAGELKPISTNDTENGRSLNRRVEISARHPELSITHSVSN